MEYSSIKEQDKKYAEHKVFIENIHKKAEEEIKLNKIYPNSIESILQNNHNALKFFKKRRS